LKLSQKKYKKSVRSAVGNGLTYSIETTIIALGEEKLPMSFHG